MRQRTDLQKLLEGIAGKGRVYFQPPSNLTMTYPCIIYARDYAETDYASDTPYRVQRRYSVTIIDPDPDTKWFDPVSMLPTASFDRHFKSDNLNHDVFSVYY